MQFCKRKNKTEREDLQIPRTVKKKIKSKIRNSSWKQLKTSDFKISCSILINTENCNADMNTRTGEKKINDEEMNWCEHKEG